jgi:hypothetical protein
MEVGRQRLLMAGVRDVVTGQQVLIQVQQHIVVDRL